MSELASEGDGPCACGGRGFASGSALLKDGTNYATPTVVVKTRSRLALVSLLFVVAGCLWRPPPIPPLEPGADAGASLDARAVPPSDQEACEMAARANDGATPASVVVGNRVIDCFGTGLTDASTTPSDAVNGDGASSSDADAGEAEGGGAPDGAVGVADGASAADGAVGDASADDAAAGAGDGG
jgi:hypothetical protein